VDDTGAGSGVLIGGPYCTYGVETGDGQEPRDISLMLDDRVHRADFLAEKSKASPASASTPDLGDDAFCSMPYPATLMSDIDSVDLVVLRRSVLAPLSGVTSSGAAPLRSSASSGSGASAPSRAATVSHAKDPECLLNLGARDRVCHQFLPITRQASASVGTQSRLGRAGR